jgi:hypothetical protein
MTRQVKKNVGRNLMLALILIFVCILLNIVIIGSDQVLRDPMAANAAGAASALRFIYLANAAYAKNHPDEGYARRLSDLSEGLGNTEHFWPIDPALASGEKQGYRFSYRSHSTRGDGKLDAYQAFADPLVPGKTGQHHLFLDETGWIRMSDRGQANAGSDPIQ